MKHVIEAVEKGSVAARHGLHPGDAMLSLDGEAVLDEIDYQALSFPARLPVEIERPGGRIETIILRKEDGEALGIRFGESMALSPRRCKNRCVFCFIDQMPPGLRKTLYVKDDDWRYSLMMGNFVTLTNVDDAEFARIIRRKASPLFVSVHATDPELRCRMMKNPHAGDILPKLMRLKSAGIRFHCQIVVCPGYNDGEQLLRTLSDLRVLAPAAQSVAMVPVGMTKCRDKLAVLTPFDQAGAQRLLAEIAPFQEACRKKLGTTFAFPSDEFYCIAGEAIPPEEWYEGYPQIENGVGLIRQLESEMEEAERFDDEPEKETPPQKLLIATGTSIAPHMRRLVQRFKPDHTTAEVVPIFNDFFGRTVTVTGLLTGGDILAQLPEKPNADRLLLVESMLRHEKDRFLDDMTVETFRERAPLCVQFVPCSGQDLYDALRAQP